MQTLGPEMWHYWLAMGMAKTTRTDLVNAMEQGVLDNSEWADMVDRCRGCAWAECCEGWLHAHMEEGADCPPTCVNQHRFNALRQEVGKAATA
ncbi:DUF6455 family protein [Vannielia sp.]|uniref:DUF6455 family protein n=1 Tax=Vannielia sp. TaxID=2813045 RepID=UPI00260AF6F4|nr:DUF6455 family protein [Vannielia sp.]MDF1872974.1 DUF6455 family protein [Vannielia sp.]